MEKQFNSVNLPSDSRGDRRYRHSWFIVLLGLLILVLAHWTALFYRIGSPAVSLWFPPSGVAITLTFWFGPIGAVLAGIASVLMAPFWGSTGWSRWVGLVDMVEPLVAWLLYRHYWQGSLGLKDLRDVVAFLVSAPLIACAASAVIGSFTLMQIGTLSSANFGQIISHWWLGNAIGTMTIVPLALLVFTPLLQQQGWLPFQSETVSAASPLDRPSRRVETIALLALALGTAALTVIKAKDADLTFQQLSFLSFLPLLWAAIRFGARGGMLITSSYIVISLLYYLLLYRPSNLTNQFPVDATVLHVHKFSLFVQAVITLLVGTAIAERTSTQVALAGEQVRRIESEQRAQLSEQLLQLNQSLSEANDRLEKTNFDLQIARQQAETANRMKDEFLAIVSHELRSPLNAILGWSRLLRTRRLPSETIERALESIERNAEAQTQLIEDLLDISRIIRGKIRLHLRPTFLIQVIEAALDTIRPTASTRQIELEAALDPTVIVSADPDRLQQIIWNLLSNAVKFTPAGGRVIVKLERHQLERLNPGTHHPGTRYPETRHPENQSSNQIPASNASGLSGSCNCAQITVTDTGVGIHPDFLPYVFERFKQADGSTSRTQGGLGLGLAIVHSLVEQHGGKVFAESQGEGMGATFIVQLPLLREEETPAKSTPVRHASLSELETSSNPQPLQNLRLLVVDDDADTRDFLITTLEHYGATVASASSTSEALQLLVQLKPDVLLSDIGMPVEDGYVLIQQVRSLPPEQGGLIPAVALTAYVREDDRRKALTVGYQMHIPKPIDTASLLSVITTLSKKGEGISGVGD